MAELDKGKPVSLEELMVATLAMTDALAKLLIEKGVYHRRGVQTEAAGGASRVSAHSEADGTMSIPGRLSDSFGR